MVSIPTREQMVSGLKVQIGDLEEQLGHARLALRAYSLEDKEPNETEVIQKRTRVYMTPEMREKYKNEIVAVLEAFGTVSVRQFMERGNFEPISSTSVYRLALEHPRVNKEYRGKTIHFSLKGP